jgi:hypothetical protein
LSNAQEENSNMGVREEEKMRAQNGETEQKLRIDDSSKMGVRGEGTV